MMTLTVVIHFFGIVALLRLLSLNWQRVAKLRTNLQHMLMLIMAVLGIVLLHTLEIWAYALLYLALGALSDFEAALYFSTVCFTTLGFGDIVLSPNFRMISAIEAANGLILFGWTTAFLISLMGKLRTLEHHWLE
ncbi:MAG: potassium channel family protein [Aestuariivirga sp.]